ncbi:MAG: hypothetical protein H6701_16925 [Myxococcales bacterium]|nr:hypothetical protein [Myxococcales bacterium]
MLPLPRHRRDLALALGALAALAAAPGSPAHAAPVIALTDPAHDDDGPGGYVHPSGRPYARGQYDLRRFEAEVVGDVLELRVTLDAPIRRPIEPRISGARTIALDNGVYVQNIDVYLDTTPGAGFTEGIPGRRVSFAPADAWDHAIVLTPQPYKVRAVLEGWGRAGAHVSVPADVVDEGRTAIARVPLDRLGGPPAPHWGYAIAVSGARWDETLAVVDLLTDDARLDAYTLPVHTVAENEAFGGGALGAAHTQVIDIFTPPGLTQRDALAGRAILPMIRLDGRPPAAPAPAAAPAPEATPAAADPTIKDILDTTVVITGAPPTAPYRLAEVYDRDGRRAGKVVVTAIHPEFVTATIVEGLATIQRGMTVRFPEPAQDAEE